MASGIFSRYVLTDRGIYGTYEEKRREKGNNHMLEVKILLSDLDYDDVADLVVPLVSDRLAAKGGLIGKIAGKKEELLKAVHKFLSQKNQDERDQFLAELVTKERSLIIEKAADFAEKKGVKVQICDISVKKI